MESTTNIFTVLLLIPLIAQLSSSAVIVTVLAVGLAAPARQLMVPTAESLAVEVTKFEPESFNALLALR